MRLAAVYSVSLVLSADAGVCYSMMIVVVKVTSQQKKLSSDGSEAKVDGRKWKIKGPFLISVPRSLILKIPRFRSAGPVLGIWCGSAGLAAPTGSYWRKQ